MKKGKYKGKYLVIKNGCPTSFYEPIRSCKECIYYINEKCVNKNVYYNGKTTGHYIKGE